MCQCNCCNDPKAEQEVYDALFSLGILMADSRKEKETEKMGKVTVTNRAKKFKDFQLGECFSSMGSIYMKTPTLDGSWINAINLETGRFKAIGIDEEFTPITEFHWTDQK